MTSISWTSFYNQLHYSLSLPDKTNIYPSKVLNTALVDFRAFPKCVLSAMTAYFKSSLAVEPSVPITHCKGSTLDPSTVKIDMSFSALHPAYWVSMTASEADWYPRVFEAYFRPIYPNGQMVKCLLHIHGTPFQ